MIWVHKGTLWVATAIYNHLVKESAELCFSEVDERPDALNEGWWDAKITSSGATPGWNLGVYGVLAVSNQLVYPIVLNLIPNFPIA